MMEPEYLDKLPPDYQEAVRKSFIRSIAIFITVIIGMAICALFSSCKSVEYVPVIEHKTDTLMVTKHQRDSVWLHDSTYIHEKGDTLLIEKWHTKYREKIVHDTTYISKCDTVPVPYPVKEYVEKKLNFFQKMTMTIGGFAILIGLIWVVIKFVVPHIKNPLP